MSNFKIKNLNISDINLDEKNPRLEPTNSQREAINAIMEDQKDKLISLIRHISENGLNPTVIALVFKENGKLVDGDGNRRVAAIKIAHTPKLLDDEKWIKKIKAINTNNFPNKIDCVIFESRDEARIWVKLNHNGQGEGEGTIPWNSKAKDRFNNKKSIGTQFIEHYVDQDNQAAYQKTTMDRFFGNKFIKDSLNIKQEEGEVVFDEINHEKVKQLIDALKNIKVSEVYNNEKIMEFYSNNCHHNNQSKKKGVSDSAKGKAPTNTRKGVIPKDVFFKIECTKTNNIFNELKKIKVKDFPNASAMLLRAFLELSVDYYIDKKGISVDNNTKLKGRLNIVYKEMSLPKDEKKALDAIFSNKDNPAHTNILNSYTHNKHHHPDPSSVKTAFDNLSVFFIKVYEK